VLAVDFLTSNQYLVEGIGVRAAACNPVQASGFRREQPFKMRYIIDRRMIGQWFGRIRKMSQPVPRENWDAISLQAISRHGIVVRIYKHAAIVSDVVQFTQMIEAKRGHGCHGVAVVYHSVDTCPRQR
jgi:hypothetical protein